MVVALSGGVDSAVAAALCVEAGHRVQAVMLRLWSDPGSPSENRCCPADSLDSAAAVADSLGISLRVIDCSALFKREVVDRFLAGVAVGLTPNPCLACNRYVRFGFLLPEALAMGADCLATGHYAVVRRGPEGTFELRRGADRAKDQSYVLSVLGQRELARALFPLGGLTKAAVRLMAARRGLPSAGRADSLDLCWLGADGLDGFLDRHLPAQADKPGPMVDTSGRVLGHHRGLARYTVGQRRGLGGSFGGPRYVVHKDMAANTLVVGEQAHLRSRRIEAECWHWVSGGAPGPGPWRVQVQTRYRSPAAGAWLHLLAGDRVVAQLDGEVLAATPGQALVAYDGCLCLGVGVIVAPPAG